MFEFMPGSPFADQLKSVELEYYWAIKLRPPGIYAFAPHLVGSTCAGGDQRNNIGVILNYRRASDQGLHRLSCEQSPWPPAEVTQQLTSWDHHVSALCLEVTQSQASTTVNFLMHDEILSRDEQGDIIGRFFKVLGAAIGLAQDSAGDVI